MIYRKIVHIKQEPFIFSLLPTGSWDYLEPMLGVEVGKLEFYYLDGDIYVLNEDLSKINKAIISSPNKIKELLNLIEKHSKDFISFCETHNQKRSLIDSLRLFFNHCKNIGANAMIMVALEDIIKNRLEKELLNHFKNLDEKELQRIFSILSTNIKESNTLKEKKSLLQLALEVPAEKLVINSEGLKSHLEAYSWLNSKFLRVTPYTKEDIIERIKSITNPQEEARRIEENSKKLEKELVGLVELTKDNPDLSNAVNDMQEICFLRTNRVEAINYGCYKIYWLFEEIGKSLQIEPQKVPFLLYEEIVEALNQGLKINPEDRMKGYALIAKNGKIEILTGDNIESARKNFESPIKTDSIKGLIASKGIAQGLVRIIKDKEEIKKINKGEILVTPMTTPDFVMAMEKSSAIVTDLGGLTSHAAIISREMNIPCIVGTGNATQLLNDGDLVVVDALEKGEVVKIDKKRIGLP